MRLKFSGTVHYANGDPVSNVAVRIFDRDASGKQDDDLTLTPGLSDEQGHFDILYEPLRFLDWHTINVVNTPNQPFDSPALGWQMPEMGDIYLPYLKFDYTLNDFPHQHTCSMGIFQSRFHLPENPAVEFLPSTHGFRFINCFPGYFLPFSLPDFLPSPKVAREYGLCGGMAAATYDFILAGRVIPQTNKVPNKGTRLQRYLYRRQIDSFGGGREVVKVARWTTLPGDSLVGVQALTAGELGYIRKKLDDKNPVVLALIYEHAKTLKELSRMIFNNHQVLAYHHQQDADGAITLQLYDPNLPCRDDVIIQSRPVTLGEVNSSSGTQAVLGLQSVQVVGGESYRMVRGFFAMPYSPVKPPAGI